MLAYMLENRGEEAEPEKLDQEKYEVVKKRQEERRQRQESGHAGRVEYTGRAEHRDNIIPMPTEGLRRMKMAATGVFVLLCVMALALMRQENTGESLEETARQAMSSLMEQKLPDAVEEQNQVSTLVAEDKLEAALRQEIMPWQRARQLQRRPLCRRRWRPKLLWKTQQRWQKNRSRK